jgi:hypothetical protein
MSAPAPPRRPGIDARLQKSVKASMLWLIDGADTLRLEVLNIFNNVNVRSDATNLNSNYQAQNVVYGDAAGNVVSDTLDRLLVGGSFRQPFQGTPRSWRAGRLDRQRERSARRHALFAGCSGLNRRDSKQPEERAPSQ